MTQTSFTTRDLAPGQGVVLQHVECTAKPKERDLEDDGLHVRTRLSFPHSSHAGSTQCTQMVPRGCVSGGEISWDVSERGQVQGTWLSGVMAQASALPTDGSDLLRKSCHCLLPVASGPWDGLPYCLNLHRGTEHLAQGAESQHFPLPGGAILCPNSSRESFCLWIHIKISKNTYAWMLCRPWNENSYGCGSGTSIS